MTKLLSGPQPSDSKIFNIFSNIKHISMKIVHSDAL